MVTSGLKRFREWLGYSQDGVATSVGMQQRTWSNWEKQAPDALIYLYDLARRHGVSTDFIVGLSDKPERSADPDAMAVEAPKTYSPLHQALKEIESVLHRFEASSRDQAVTDTYLVAMRFVEKHLGIKAAEDLYTAVDLFRRTGDDSALATWFAAYLGGNDTEEGNE